MKEVKKAVKKAVKKTAKKATKKVTKFWVVGKSYFIRGVNNYYTGKLVGIDGPELIFIDAAWIADTGRFADAMKNPDKFSEIEPYPDGWNVLVNRQSVCDAVIWPHPLPRKQK